MLGRCSFLGLGRACSGRCVLTGSPLSLDLLVRSVRLLGHHPMDEDQAFPVSAASPGPHLVEGSRLPPAFESVALLVQAGLAMALRF